MATPNVPAIPWQSKSPERWQSADTAPMDVPVIAKGPMLDFSKPNRRAQPEQIVAGIALDSRFVGWWTFAFHYGATCHFDVTHWMPLPEPASP